MIRIAALNDSSSEDGSQSNISLRGKSTKEAKEAEAYSLYNKALTLLRNGKVDEAEETFRDLIEHDFLLEASDLLEERSDSDNVLHPEFQLLYSIYKNLAVMATQRQDYRSAMEWYLEAIKIDNSEVTVWYKIGQTALKIEDFQLAQLAFEQGLVCSPKHWPCLDNLITLLYALNNYWDCLYYVSKAFELDIEYEKGHAFREKIIREQPSLKEDTSDLYQFCASEILDYDLDPEEAQTYIEDALTIRRRKQELSIPPEPERLSFPPKLKAYSWKCVGEQLVSLYDKATTSDPIISICLKMKIPDYSDVLTAGEDSDDRGPETATSDSKHTALAENENMEIDVENSRSGIKNENSNKIEKGIDSDLNKTECAIETDSVPNAAQKDGDIQESKVQSAETRNVVDSIDKVDDKLYEKNERTAKEEQNGEQAGEDVEMESDDSVLEAFKTTSTLLDGLSPCKDNSNMSDKKDTTAVPGIVTGDNAYNAVPNYATKVEPVTDNTNVGPKLNLTDKINEIENKPLNVDQTEVHSLKGAETSTQEQTSTISAGAFGSAVSHHVQKDLSLTKSSSFGFTPSVLPEPHFLPALSVSPLVSSSVSAVSSALSTPSSGPVSECSPLVTSQTNIITQDHGGYTTPNVTAIPVPNLQISITQASSFSSSVNHSPILASCLTAVPGGQSAVTTTLSQTSSPSHPYSNSQPPLIRHDSGGFNVAAMTTDNIQTGSGAHYTSNSNIPVTQSLQKSIDSGTIPSSLFVADFDDQSLSGRKSQKRKRISTATEEIMMYGKRRSARVRNTGRKKEEETVNFMELLQAFLPSSLKKVNEDEVKETEVKVKTPEQEKSPVAMETEMEKSESYQEWNEEAEVKRFLHNNLINSGLMILMNDYIHRVAQLEKCKWEEGLAEVYLAVYSRVRKHVNTPNIFCSGESQENIRNFCKVCLVWGELQLDQWLTSRARAQGLPSPSPRSQSYNLLTDEDLPYNYIEDTWYIMACCGQSDSLQEDWAEHCIRAFWMKARLHMLQGNMEDAIFCFERTKEYLQQAAEEDNIHSVFVANVKTDNIITEATVSVMQESLQRTQSVEEIERLSEKGDNEKVVELLLQTFEQPKDKSKFLKQNIDVSERQSQLTLLQDTLYKLGDMQKCLFWGEESFEESYQQYQKASLQSVKSDWLKTMIKIFSSLQRVLEKDLSTVKSLPSVKLVRFSQNLVHMIDTNMSLHESVTEMKIDTVLPWVLLYQLIKHEEDKMESLRGKELGGGDADLEDSLPSSQMLLNISHDYLGNRSWCCRSDGALLMFFMHVLKPKIYSESNLLDEYQQAFEQCVYCLYGHPRKGKAKHLQDHNAPGVTLQWEEAVEVFEYFKPKSMPEFDGYRSETISAESECLLKRIVPLIPNSVKNMGLLADDIQKYIEGESSIVPNIPEGREVTLPVVSEIYYLLGDYYLKNKEVGKAIKFYIQDLCVNPGRLDSWAGMALARMSQLEQKLSSVELKMDTPIFRRSISALRCFKRAMEIDYANCKLWIEYGSLAYILHSHASRQLKWKAWFAMKEEFLQIARDSKEEMLQTAYNCFIKAAECCDEGSEEEWIQKYMTAKCLEKMGKPAKEFLPYYAKAGEHLHDGGAKYPKKIVYAYTTPHYAVEALEMYFRQHVAILKRLLKHSPSSEELEEYKVYLTFLLEASRSPFAKRIEKGQENRTDRDSASSADESSCSGVASPSKKKNTKYQIPSDDHTYVRQKSNQGSARGLFPEPSDQSQSQSQSQDNVTLTPNMPPASTAASMVTTLELHSEQTSSQEHETLTTTKCPEQFIEQKPTLPDQAIKTEAADANSKTIAAKPSSDPLDDAHKHSSNGTSVKKEKEEVRDLDTQSTVVPMDTNVPIVRQTSYQSLFPEPSNNSQLLSQSDEKDITAVKVDENKDNVDLSKVSETESSEKAKERDRKESEDSVIIIEDQKEENLEKKSEQAGNTDPVSASESSTTGTSETEDKKAEPDKEKTVEELVAIAMEKSPEELHRDLVEMCFKGVELCLKRFPTHYKSHYRLAYMYVYSPYHKDLTKAHNLLLGVQKWSQYDYMPCQGLFYERKPTKFFQGIWKIPIDEIDRSGTFPSHLNKCITLLLEVLKRQRDPATLFQIHVHLNRQPEAGKKYLRDAERKYYTLQSFKFTLDAIEQQTNVMKVVTDSETRLKYLMTVYKIWEHGVHKLNKDVERGNRLFAEAYRVVLRKLETLPAGMLLNEALRFCKHQQAKKNMGKDKNQGSVSGKLGTQAGTKVENKEGKTGPVAASASISTPALQRIMGPQMQKTAALMKASTGSLQKISSTVPSKTVSAAQKLISLAKISKIGKSQPVNYNLPKANKSNNNSATLTKMLKIPLTDIAKDSNNSLKKMIGAAAIPKGSTVKAGNKSASNSDDVIILSDDTGSERDSPTKPGENPFTQADKSAAATVPTVKIKMGLLQLAKLKQNKAPSGTKNTNSSETDKGNSDESESEAPIPEEMSEDDSSSSSTTSSSSSSSSSDDDSSSESDEDDDNVDKTEKSKAEKSTNNVLVQRKSHVTVPKATKVKAAKVAVAKVNDTDDADDEAVTAESADAESEMDEIVVLDDESDNTSDSEENESDVGSDDDDEIVDDKGDKDYSASGDEPDLSDDDVDMDDAKDADVVMISESESEDEFAPKGRAIIPSPPHSKIKEDLNKTVVLVSEMPDFDPILSSIISSATSQDES